MPGRGSFCARRGTGKHRFGRSASRSRTSGRRTSGRRAFDAADYEKLSKLDKTVDALREKYGEQALSARPFIGRYPNMAGGLSKHRRTGITKPVDEPEQYVLAHLKEGKIKL